MPKLKRKIFSYGLGEIFRRSYLLVVIPLLVLSSTAASDTVPVSHDYLPPVLDFQASANVHSGPARDNHAVDSSFSLNSESDDKSTLSLANGSAEIEFLDSLTFDIDGNGKSDALTDGLLLIRSMFGFTGDALIAGAIDTDATYISAAVIAARIDRLGNLIDIDDNGQVHALTDGLVIIRYLFGLRGESLIEGAIASDAMVTSATDIGIKIENRVKRNSLPVASISLSSEGFVAGSKAFFTGEGSIDEEDETLSYSWGLEKPDYSLAKLDNTNSESITFTPDAIGEYTLTLSVADRSFGKTSTSKSFTAASLPNFSATPPPVGIIDGDVDAARFLIQATFGPTVLSVKELLEKGGEAWFTEQTNLPFTSWTELRKNSWIEEFDPMDSDLNGKDWLVELFSETAQNSPDQLRHRVAYSLSQLFVISRETDLGHRELPFIDYWDVLGRNAFGNFRDLLEAVTLHPTMGHYLNMIGNMKADPENNIRPDENFAREVIQLFTIGLRQLNQDGSVKRNSTGEAIETYNQETITQYAAALTGWYYDTRGLDVNRTTPFDEFSCTITCFPIELAKKPMVAFDYIHQKTEKRLLRGYYIPPGQSAEQDLKIVLDSLFNHPNLAPFFSLHLIKQMVTSNPSPEYVGRVSAVFNNNGQGVRGDIGATVKAVLFDLEARKPDLAKIPNYGKVKEPLMFITHINRLFDVTLLSPETVSADNLWGQHRWMRIAGDSSQRALYAEDVFNFFRPDFAPNGEIADMGLVAPELQIITEASIVNDIELFRWITTKEMWEQAITNGRDPNQFTLVYDFSLLDKVWESEGYPAVINHLNLYMTGGRMDLDYKNNLISLSSDPDYAGVFDGEDPSWSETYTDQMERHSFLIQLIYLIITTPEFRVQQ